MPSPLAQLGAGNAVRRRPRLALPGILAGATTHADAAALATAAIPIFLSRGAVPSLYKVRRKPLSRRGGCCSTSTSAIRHAVATLQCWHGSPCNLMHAT